MERRPRISIVTPLVDQARSIVETVESVMSQEYANVEHIVIDDGADDEPVARYPQVKVVSAPVAGRADAVNAGFRLATGDVLTVLGAGETLRPGTLSLVAQEIDPQRARHAVMSRCRLVDERGLFVGIEHPRPPESHRRMLEVWNHPGIEPAGVFWARDVWRTCGPLDDSLGWVESVYDFFCRVSRSYRFAVVDPPLATYRARPELDGGWAREAERRQGSIAISRRYWGSPLSPTYWRVALSLARFRFDRVGRARRYLRLAQERWARSERLGAIPAAVAGAIVAPEVGFYVGAYPPLRERGRRIWQTILARMNRFDSVPPETAVYLDRTEAWSDGWVGPRLAVNCDAEGHTRAVSIRGWADLRRLTRPLVLTVRVDGQVVGRHRVRRAGDFVANIWMPEALPPGTHTVEVEASAWFVPDHHTRSGDMRPLAWRPGEVALHTSGDG